MQHETKFIAHKPLVLQEAAVSMYYKYRVLQKLLQATVEKYLNSAKIVLTKIALPLLLQIQPKWNYKRYPPGYLHKP